jgi:formylglycine-generating enzyme required for sulfatase activity
MSPENSPPPDSGDSIPGDHHDVATVHAASPDLPAQPRIEPPTHASPPALHVTPGEPATMPEMSRVERQPVVFELSGYEILGEIAHGGMGVVYKARQISLDRLVALKCVPPSVQSDPDRLRRFQTEATAAAKLMKHGILPVYDVLHAGGAPILVMPYIEGSDLAHIIADRIAVKNGQSAAQDRHPWASLADESFLERILSLLDRVIDALVLLHQVNVLHRDIKPSNILVDVHGDAWLADFGLARFGNQQGTVWAETVGTPGYMSPEQWNGQRDIDGRADVFSLGVTAYQALTLELPYARNRVTTATRLNRTTSQLNPLVPDRLGAVVEKAIAPDRSARYQSAAEFKDAWKQARHEAVGTEPGSWWRRATRWQRAAAISCIAALLLLISGGAWGLGHWAASGGDTGALEPQKQTVWLTTEPAGAMVIFVPLHPDTGEPQEQWAVRPPPGQTTPLEIELPPGTYFVEAALTNGQFHQVYREVPMSGQEQGSPFPHKAITVRGDGVRELRAIKIPAAGVTGPMARFLGSNDFIMGCNDLPEAQPPHVHPVKAFLLDVHEVTEREYGAACGNLPVNLATAKGPDFAVSHVTYDEALKCAELMGKRLPTEAEYEWAATNGGTQDYPWGNEKERIQQGWPLLVVRQPEFDHTSSAPAVFGLYSNVAEWTTSWLLPYPGLQNPPTPPEDYRSMRIVRGGPYSLVLGRQIKEPSPLGPRYRYAIRVDRPSAGLGFRCARTERPLFLHP